MAQDLAKKIEERMAHREKLCMVIQNDITGLATKVKKLFDLDLETYQMLNEPDALFNDSPIAPLKTAHLLKQFMIKKDLDFIGYVLDGKQSIKPFLDCAQEVSRWVMRFATEKKPQKTGLDAIV